MSRRRCFGVTATIVLVFSLVFIAPFGGAVAQAPTELARERAIVAALAWLRAQQAADGSFGGSVGNTIEVALAAAAAGEDLSAWRVSGGPSIQDYLVAQAGQYAVDAGTTGKLLTAVVAAGLDPRNVGGLDLAHKLSGYDDGQGAFSTTALAQAWAMLGLAAASQATGFAGGPIPRGAAPALIAFQQADGGWEGGPGWGTDSNTTALVVQALVAAGVPATDPALTRAREYLRTQLAPDGGFTYSAQWGDAPDANSTAYGIQGLLALGEDPAADTWTRSGRTPWDALLAFQLEGGAFEWQSGGGANLLATAQAVPALAGVTYPLHAAGAAPAPIVLEEGQALSHTLIGRRAGAHVLYRLSHPGGGREAAVEVSTPSAHPLVLAGFGLNVYDQNGRHLGRGVVTASSPQHVLRFGGASDSPAEWTVQVYNYNEGMPLPYSIVAEGLGVVQGRPTPEAQPTARPEDIPALIDAVQGTLVGDRGGAHARYWLRAPSEGEDLVVRMYLNPDDPAIGAGLGFTIYTPSGRAVPGAHTSVPGERVARIAGATAGEYLVQVHNYIPGVSMSYALTR